MSECGENRNEADRRTTTTAERDSVRSTWGELLRAVETWSGRGDADLLARWLARELDADGAPVRLAIAEWPSILDRLVGARVARSGWPSEFDERLLAFFRMTLRFSRPDGRPAAAAVDLEEAGAARRRLARLGDAFPGSDAERVLGWWPPARKVEPIPPPLPAWSSGARALGVLRADWLPRGDFVVFDHREPGEASRLEVFGSGLPWLSDAWSAPRLEGAGKPTAGKPLSWTTTSAADVAEWTFRVGKSRVVRTAVLLRGRKVAILADLVEGIKSPTTVETRWGLPPGRLAEPIAESRALRLRAEKPGASLQAIPAALPSRPYETDRGRFDFDPATGELVLTQSSTGTRTWLPLLLSWNRERNRRRLQWRVLTVSENYRACSPETAWAARVSWGRFETLVIYRSLGPPARRSFLGFTTTARLFVGRFTPEGDVDPIIAIDGE